MKHLKQFNETNDINYKDQITKLCNDNLAYLKDGGFEYDINSTPNNKVFNIVIQKEVASGVLPWSEIAANNKKREFTWNDIKYDFIPFVELLSSGNLFKPYEFLFIEMENEGNIARYEQQEYHLPSVLNDSIDDDKVIVRVNIYIVIKEKSRLKRFFGL